MLLSYLLASLLVFVLLHPGVVGQDRSTHLRSGGQQLEETDPHDFTKDHQRRLEKVCSVNEGLYWSADCDDDEYCLGNMYLAHCYDGSDGDMCKTDDQCQGDMVCYGVSGSIFAYCRNKRGEGDECGSDKICSGYCHNLQCRDGSEGDPCGKESDCQDGLTCIGTAGLAKCRKQKNEGEWCGHDDDCKGYCQFGKCWDGSKGDKCKYSSDCQGSLQCKKRCRICAQKVCK